MIKFDVEVSVAQRASDVLDKDLRRIAKALEAQGFETATTSKGHLRVFLHGKAVAKFSLRRSQRPRRRSGRRR
jgi:hypothetical protein